MFEKSNITALVLVNIAPVLIVNVPLGGRVSTKTQAPALACHPARS
jgi:hypothetical protein